MSNLSQWQLQAIDEIGISHSVIFDNPVLKISYDECKETLSKLNQRLNDNINGHNDGYIRQLKQFRKVLIDNNKTKQVKKINDELQKMAKLENTLNDEINTVNLELINLKRLAKIESPFARMTNEQLTSIIDDRYTEFIKGM